MRTRASSVCAKATLGPNAATAATTTAAATRIVCSSDFRGPRLGRARARPNESAMVACRHAKALYFPWNLRLSCRRPAGSEASYLHLRRIRLMLRSFAFRGLALPGLCSLPRRARRALRAPCRPASPPGRSTANPDGSTLKVTAPSRCRRSTATAPRRCGPTFTLEQRQRQVFTTVRRLPLQLSSGRRRAWASASSRRAAAGRPVYETDVDFAFDSRLPVARARRAAGPTPGRGRRSAQFKTPLRPVAGGPFTGGVGPQRSIFFDEAFDIIVRIHNELRINLGPRLDARVPRRLPVRGGRRHPLRPPALQPGGPDPSWCVKDAGGGRPPSDDVLVLLPVARRVGPRRRRRRQRLLLPRRLPRRAAGRSRTSIRRRSAR